MIKNTQKLVRMIPLLEDIEFIGLAKILSVPLVDEENVERDFADVLENVLATFEKLPRTNRRKLLKIVESATEGKKLEDMRRENIEGAPPSESVNEVNEVENESEN